MRTSSPAMVRSAFCLLAVSLLSCTKTLQKEQEKASVKDLSQAESAAAARMAAFQPEDLALNFLDTEGTKHAPLSLKDLGLSDSDIEAVRKGTHDSTLAGVFGSDQACVQSAKNWFVTSIRFAPNGIAFPGQPKVWKTWAESLNSRIDRMPEIRYVVRPFCAPGELGGTIMAEDSAMHVIFRPSTVAGVDKNQALGKNYATLELSGKRTEANAIARTQLEVMSSETWGAHRVQVIEDWNAVSRVRDQQGQRTQTLQDLIQGVMTLTNSFVFGPATHSDLENPNTSAVFAEVKKFTSKYAVRSELFAVTSMLSTPSRIWRFGSFALNNRNELEVKRMLTFGARLDAGNVRLNAVAEQLGGMNAPGPLQPGSIVALPGVTDEVFAAQEGGFAPDISTELPSPEQFPAFRAAVTNLEMVNPSTMTCSGCHKLAASFNNEGLIDGNNEAFQMTEFGRINVFMAKEILEESELLNKEFSLKKKGSLQPTQGSNNKPTPPIACKVNSADGPMNVRLVPDGKILGQVTDKTPFMKMGIEGDWVRVQIRISNTLFGAGGSGSPTAYIHNSGVLCP